MPPRIVSNTGSRKLDVLKLCGKLDASVISICKHVYILENSAHLEYYSLRISKDILWNPLRNA